MRNLILLFALALGSCATITNTPYDTLQFKGDVKATLYVNDVHRGQVPRLVEIKTKKEKLVNIRIEAEGYQPHETTLRTRTGAGWVVVDILLTGGLGLIVDGATDKWKALEVKEYRYNLRPVPSGETTSRTPR